MKGLREELHQRPPEVATKVEVATCHVVTDNLLLLNSQDECLYEKGDVGSLWDPPEDVRSNVLKYVNEVRASSFQLWVMRLNLT